MTFEELAKMSKADMVEKARELAKEHRNEPEFSRYFEQRQWRRAIMVALNIELPGEEKEEKKEEEPAKPAWKPADL